MDLGIGFLLFANLLLNVLAKGLRLCVAHSSCLRFVHEHLLVGLTRLVQHWVTAVAEVKIVHRLVGKPRVCETQSGDNLRCGEEALTVARMDKLSGRVPAGVVRIACVGAGVHPLVLDTFNLLILQALLNVEQLLRD